MLQIKNRTLPAWIGSILFHIVLVVFILLWFSSDHDRGMPGERNAVGSIVLQSSGGSRQQAESLTDSQNTESENATAEWANLSNANLNLLPPTPVIAPGQQHTTGVGTDSVSEIAASFQQGTQGNAGVGTGEASVQIFGTHGKGTKFMYIFDRSGSMEGMPVRAAKAELIRSLDSLGDLHQFNIVFYSTDYQLWQPGRRLPFATPTNKQNAVRFVESMTAAGNTNHYPPLEAAIAHRPDVIFFLTDGERKDDLSPLQLSTIERMNSRMGRGTQINVIQFGSGGLTDSPSKSLQQLADQNNGEYRYVNVLTELR